MKNWTRNLKGRKLNLEKEREASFSSDSHEDNKSNYKRESRYAGDKGSENSELVEKQAEALRKRFEIED